MQIRQYINYTLLIQYMQQYKNLYSSTIANSGKQDRSEING